MNYNIYTHIISYEIAWYPTKPSELRFVPGSCASVVQLLRCRPRQGPPGWAKKNATKREFKNDSWWSFVDDFYLKIKETMNESGYWKMSLIHGLNDDRHSGKHHFDVIRSRLAFRRSPIHGKSWGWLIVESFFKGTGSNRQNAVFSHTIICN